jgi:hypothetical protein
MRALTDEERGVVLRLSKEIKSPEEERQLLTDLANCTVQEAVPDGSRLRFEVPGYERPTYRGQHGFRGKDGFPVEGTMKDIDGIEMDVYLFADENNRLLELELNKHAPSPVIRPDWSTFKVK